MMIRNLVKMRVGFCNAVFEFDDVCSAARFMDEALAHLCKEESEREVKISMQRIVVEEKEE